MNIEELISNKDIKTLAGRYYRYLDSYSKKDLEQEFFLYCFERIDNIEDKDIINLCKECYKKILYKQGDEVIGVSCDFLEEIKEGKPTDIYITTKSRQDLSYKEWYKEHREQKLKYLKEYYRKHSEELKARARVRYREDEEYREKEKARARVRANKWYKEHKEERRKYDEEHKEERKAYIKKWQEKNKEKVKEYNKKYIENHKEEINTRRRERYKENKENKERRKTKRREYYLKNREKILQREREYYKKKKERINEDYS